MKNNKHNSKILTDQILILVRYHKINGAPSTIHHANKICSLTLINTQGLAK